MIPLIGVSALAAFVLLSLILMVAARYKKCPSDHIMVVYGLVGKEKSAKCIHGGAQFVWPFFQDYRFLSLRPMQIEIPLKGALSRQNIRINTPSTYTIGISVEPEIMRNAAERLLSMDHKSIESTAREIIFGQQRLVIASMDIEEINASRDLFLANIKNNVETELNKIGLRLINVNITDITDESDYIESIGKKAASEAINKAKVDVAEQNKRGAIGEAEATREREIKVAENIAEAEKGKKRAEADRRIFIQGQEAAAMRGENEASADIALTNADLTVQRAEATRRGEVAHREAQTAIQKSQYAAELERLNADGVVRQEIERKKVEIAAAAEGEKKRLIAVGQASAVLAEYEAQAKGMRQLLESKAAGYESLIRSCQGDAQAASTFLMIEKIEKIVEKQVEAIRNLKIDKVTVWDSGSADGKGSSTANFVSSLVRSLPPLQELSAMAGVELPEYLGKLADEKKSAAAKPVEPKK
jgi:flotillin